MNKEDEGVQREEARAFWAANSAMRNAMITTERHPSMKQTGQP